MVFDNEIDKWERQPEERSAEYKYFSFFLTEYVKNSFTSIQKTSEFYQRSDKYITNISNKNKWKERADAYIQYLGEQNRAKLEKEYEKVCNDTMLQIVAISQITGQKINSIITKVKNAKGDEELINEALGNITLPQLSQVLKLNQDIMKTILRIPDNQEVSVVGKVATTLREEPETLKQKLDKLSPEEREMYLDMCEKVNNEE